MKTIKLTNTEKLSGLKNCKKFALQDYKKMWWKELGTDELGNNILYHLGLSDQPHAKIFKEQGAKIKNVISQIDELIENKFSAIHANQQKEEA